MGVRQHTGLAASLLSTPHIYIRLWRDRVLVRNIDTGAEIEVRPPAAFSTRRLLVGEFSVADAAVRRGVDSVVPRSIRKPRALIQPMEYTDGGLSQVEGRVLLELASGGRMGKVVVWEGPELSDETVKRKLNAV